MVYTAGILAEIGDITRFEDQAALAKYAGLTWRKHQSGPFEAEDTKRIRSGNRFLRYGKKACASGRCAATQRPTLHAAKEGERLTPAFSL